MSEFKYACPVCGQHIKCDSSQSGSVMECPTCFQKITVPQAPADGDQKFILTGSKTTEKKYSLPKEPGVAIVPEKKFPAAVFMVGFVIAILAAGVAFYFIHGNRASEKPLQVKAPGNSTASSAWQSHDIGVVGAAGSSSQSKGLFTLIGSGADIWHQSDGFHFVFRSVAGDGSLTAEVLSIKNTDEWAKAGVMIRDSTNGNSVFALASIRSDGQAQMIWRSAAGDEAQASDLAGGTGYPRWVKIVRAGNSFSAFFKATGGDAWAQLGGTQNITMSPNAQIGLIVCSHNDGTMCDARFDNVSLEGESEVKPAAPKAPKLIAPPASDANWSLNLESVTNFTDAPVAGRVHGRDFIVERASLLNGTLILREGARGPVEFGVTINFEGALPETLSGKTINISTNADKAARVTLRWKDDDQVSKESFNDSYALRLEFGVLANNRLPGKIYLCTPDAEKSYLMGAFNADARKPKAPKPKK